MKIFEIVNKGKGLIEELEPENLLLIEDRSGQTGYVQRAKSDGTLEDSNIYDTDEVTYISKDVEVDGDFYVSGLVQNSNYDATLTYSTSVHKNPKSLTYVNGEIYFANRGTSGGGMFDISKVDLNGNIIDVFNGPESPLSQIHKLVEFDSYIYYILNTGTASILYRIDPLDDTVDVIVNLPKEVYDYAFMSSTELLYVTVKNPATIGDIYVVDVEAETYETLNIGTYELQAIATDFMGFIYVGEFDGDRTFKINNEGDIIDTFTLLGTGPNGSAMATSDDNKIYLFGYDHIESIGVLSGEQITYQSDSLYPTYDIKHIQFTNGELYGFADARTFKFTPDGDRANVSYIATHATNDGLAVDPNNNTVFYGYNDAIYHAVAPPMKLITTDNEGRLIFFEGELNPTPDFNTVLTKGNVATQSFTTQDTIYSKGVKLGVFKDTNVPSTFSEMPLLGVKITGEYSSGGGTYSHNAGFIADVYSGEVGIYREDQTPSDGLRKTFFNLPYKDPNDGDGVHAHYTLATTDDIGASGIIDTTMTNLYNLIDSESLIPGATYRISGAQPTLYNDGTNSGTTIYLTALTTKTLTENGHGEFYNPNYSEPEDDSNIWSNLVTFSSKPHQEFESTYLAHAGTTPEAIVKGDHDGFAYVVCSGSERVFRIEPDGSTSSSYGVVGTSPMDLCFDGEYNLFVCNSGDNTITKIPTGGGTSSVFASTGTGPSRIIANLSTDDIYTSNFFSNTITKVTPGGTATTFAATGFGPSGLILANDNNIYVVNKGSNNVTKITMGGTATTFATTGLQPVDICQGADGSLYVINSGDNNITKITLGGTSSVFASVGTNPSAIVYGSDNNLYVTNRDDNNVSIIDMSGNSSIYATVGTTPCDLVVTNGSGRLWVINHDSNDLYRVGLEISDGDFFKNEMVSGDNGATGRLIGTIYSNMLEPTGGDWSTATYMQGDESGDFVDFVEVVVATYPVDSIAVWGGYVWKNTTGDPGTSTSIFELDEDNWLKLPYDEVNYTKVTDIIEFEIEHNWISRRYDVGSGNDITCTFNNYTYMNGEFDLPVGGFPINVFKFGKPFKTGPRYGIGNIKVDNGFNENINFNGAYQLNMYFKPNSRQLNCTFMKNSYQNDITFESNSKQIYSIFCENSGQSGISFDTGAYHDNIFLSANSYQVDITLGKLAMQSDIFLDAPSYQENITMGTGAYQTGITIGTQGYQSYMTFGQDSYQEQITIQEYGYQYGIVFGVSSYQEQFNINIGAYQNQIHFGIKSYQEDITIQDSLYQENLTFGSESFQSSCELINGSQKDVTFMTNCSITEMNLNVDMKCVLVEPSLQVYNPDFSSATHINQEYMKTIYKRPDGNIKMRFYNNSDTMVIAEVGD